MAYARGKEIRTFPARLALRINRRYLLGCNLIASLRCCKSFTVSNVPVGNIVRGEILVLLGQAFAHGKPIPMVTAEAFWLAVLTLSLTVAHAASPVP